MATNKVTLTDADCWTIGSFLRSAALRFGETAGEFKKPGMQNPGFAAQFDKQKAEAEKFAALFENAASVTVETEEE